MSERYDPNDPVDPPADPPHKKRTPPYTAPVNVENAGDANPRNEEEPIPSRAWNIGGLGFTLLLALVVAIMLIAMAVLWAT